MLAIASSLAAAFVVGHGAPLAHHAAPDHRWRPCRQSSCRLRCPRRRRQRLWLIGEEVATGTEWWKCEAMSHPEETQPARRKSLALVADPASTCLRTARCCARCRSSRKAHLASFRTSSRMTSERSAGARRRLRLRSMQRPLERDYRLRLKLHLALCEAAGSKAWPPTRVAYGGA